MQEQKIELREIEADYTTDSEYSSNSKPEQSRS